MNLLNMKNMDVLKSQPIKIFNSQLLKSDNQKIYGPFCQYFSLLWSLKRLLWGHFTTFEILILTPPPFTLTTNYTIQKGRLKKKSFFSDNMNIEAQGA